MVLVEISAKKTTNLGIWSWTHFWEVRSDAWPWLMAPWKAHGRLSIALIELFFAIYCGSRVMRRNVHSSAVFTGGQSLCTQILPGQGRLSSTILGFRKLLNGEDRVPLSAFPCFDTTLECDGQTGGRTDRRICRSVYSACKVSFAALYKTVRVFGTPCIIITNI